MAFLSWDLLLRLIGEAAERCSMADLQGIQTEPENLFTTSTDATGVGCKDRLGKISLERAHIQSAHQNPPQKPLTKRKLRGRGFSKGKKSERMATD